VLLVVGFLLPAVVGHLRPLRLERVSPSRHVVAQLSGARVLVAMLRGQPAETPPLFRWRQVRERDLTETISDDLVSNASLGGQHRSYPGGVEYAWASLPAGLARYCVIPLWPLALPAAWMLAAWPLRRALASRRAREGLCRMCGYNLVGNASGRCPECGTPLERTAAA
jgi:hypothetical protein